MRAPLILAFLVLAAAIGGTIWFIGPGAETDDGLAGTTPDATEVDGPNDGELLEPTQRDAAESAERAFVPATNEPLASGDSDDARTVLTGRVVDDLGRGVEGADVSAGSPSDPWAFAVLGDRAGSDGRETTTGADGRFELALRAAGDVQLGVAARGFAPFEERVTATAGSTLDVGELALDPGVVLSGRVLDRGGRPVVDAEIRRERERQPGIVVITGGPSGDVVATTDREGRFEVPSQRVGPWKLSVTHEAHPSETAQGETEQTGVHVNDIEVVLEDGFEISGRVTGAPASEARRLEVRARPSSGGGQRQTISYGPAGFGPGAESRSADVASDGSFTVRGLRQGKDYSLAARLSDSPAFSRATRSPGVAATAGDTGVEIEYSLGSALVFQVVDGPSGLPIEKLEVEAGLAWREVLRGPGSGPLEHFPEGRVRYDGLRPTEGNSTATLQVRAVGYEDHQQKGIEMEPGVDVDLGVIRLKPVPVVRVAVTDTTTGDPVAGANVTLTVERAPSNARSFRIERNVDGSGHAEAPAVFHGGAKSNRGVTGEDGVCALTSFPGETCKIAVEHDEHAPYESQPLRLPGRDDFDHDVAMTQGGVAVVKVVDSAGNPLPGARVDHEAPGDGGGGGLVMLGGGPRPGGVRSNADGEAEFRHLAEGTHAFRIADDNPTSGGISFATVGVHGAGGGRGEGWEEVFVKGGETAEITLRAPGRGDLWGVVTEDGKPLANARVVLRDPDANEGLGLLGAFGGETAATTDSAGRYELSEIKVDDYRLEITHATRIMAASFDVTVQEGDNKENVELAVSIVEGRVTDEKGEPVEGARVTIEREKKDGSPTGQRVRVMITADIGEGGTMISAGTGNESSATTDEEGRYQMRGVEPDTSLYVEAKVKDYKPTSSEQFVVGPGELRTGVDVKLSKGGTLEVSIVDAEGEAVDGILVTAAFQGESPTQVDPLAALSQDGSAKFEGVLPGPWSVSLRRVGDPEAEMPEPKGVEIRDGEAASAAFEVE